VSVRTKPPGAQLARPSSSDGSSAERPRWWRPANALAYVGRHRVELATAGGSAILATLIGAWVLQLWNASLHVPFMGETDAILNLMIIKDVVTHGWFLTNPNLAAPYGQELYDFPAWSGDNFYLFIIKLLGLVFHNAAVVMNVYFLLGFPLIVITSFAVLRRLGISLWVASVCSILYAVLPSRFLRGEVHIFLGSYFMVPICCYIVIALLGGHELFGRRDGGPRVLRYLTWRSVGIALLCLVVGSSDTYFAAFTVALMFIAAILRFIAARSLPTLACGMVAAAIVLGGMGANELPTVIYTAEHGKDTQLVRRAPDETQTYGLSLANLVLPIEGHRIPLLAELAKEYQTTTIAPTGTGEAAWDNLGIVGTLGLLGLVLFLCVRCLRGTQGKIEDLRPIYAALAAGIAFLIGTVGGLATLFAYIVAAQLRAPDRISIFIGFFAIFGVALGLDHLRNRFKGSRRGRVAFASLLAIVLVLGALDQTSPQMVPDYQAEIAAYNTDGTFVQGIEAQVPRNAAIFQIPYIPFPETGRVDREDSYEEMIGYLHSTDLRWTAGSLIGRPSDWEATATRLPLANMLEEVSAAGFSGVYVDTFALSEGGTELLSKLRAALGVAPLVSSDGRLYFFNMSRYNRQLRSQRSPATIAQLANAALHPEG
jgi:hypothetical protein